MPTDDSGPTRAIVHRNLLLIRAADEAQMDAFLGRASVRALLVNRPEPDCALFPRGALAAVRKRLEDMETPFVVGEPAGGLGRGEATR